MTAPNLQAEGAQPANVTTGTLTLTLPAHQADDILVAVVAVWVPNTAGSAAQIPALAGWTKQGFVQFPATPDGEVALFWKRATSGAEANPTFTRGAGWDTGTDTAYGGRAFCVRGCATTGDPWDDFATTAALTAANGAVAAVTVAGAERMVVQFLGKTDDFATAPTIPGWTAGVQTENTGGTDTSFGTFRTDNTSTSTTADTSTVEAVAQGAYVFFGVSFIPREAVTGAGAASFGGTVQARGTTIVGGRLTPLLVAVRGTAPTGNASVITTNSFTPVKGWLVAKAWGDSAASASNSATVTDSLTGTWTAIGTRNFGGGGEPSYAQAAYQAIGPSPAEMTVSFDNAADTFQHGGWVEEWDYLDAAGPVGAVGGSSGGATADPITGSVTTTTDGSLVVAAASNWNAGTWAANAGTTLVASQSTADASGASAAKAARTDVAASVQISLDREPTASNWHLLVFELIGAPSFTEVTGAAAAVFGFTAAAAGTRATSGAAAATLGGTVAGGGTREVGGGGAASFGFAVGAQGAPERLGQGAAPFGFAVAASGERVVVAQAACSFGFAAASSGVVSGGGGGEQLGSATLLIGFTAAGLGVAAKLGAAAAAFGFTAVGAGGEALIITRLEAGGGVTGLISAAAGVTGAADATGGASGPLSAAPGVAGALEASGQITGRVGG